MTSYWDDKKCSIINNLESKIQQFYKNDQNSEITGMLRAQIVTLAHDYYKLFGDFYRRVWNNDNLNNNNYSNNNNYFNNNGGRKNEFERN